MRQGPMARKLTAKQENSLSWLQVDCIPLRRTFRRIAPQRCRRRLSGQPSKLAKHTTIALRIEELRAPASET